MFDDATMLAYEMGNDAEQLGDEKEPSKSLTYEVTDDTG